MPRPHRFRSALLTALVLASAALASGPAPVPAGPDFRARLDAALLGPNAAREISAIAVDLQSGRVIWEHGADTPLVPASNAKLWTTAAALGLLGEDYEFTTTLWGRGRLVGDAWQGDLKVVGEGDPSIGGRFHEGNPTAIFEKWARDLKGGGIRRVTGDIIIDDTFFDAERKHDTWPRNDPSKWYLAEVGALSLNENCVELLVKPDGGGGVAVTPTPDTGYVEIDNGCGLTSNREEHVINVSRPAGSNRFKVWGKVWTKSTGYTGSFSVHDPGLFFGAVLREALAAQGVAVGGEVRRVDVVAKGNGEDSDGDAPGGGGEPGAAPAGKWLKMAVHRSPLVWSVRLANTRSQNFHAEQILKTIGRRKKGEGSFAAGAMAVREYLVRLGIPAEEARIVDGSGLSSENAVSARALATLLRHAARGKHGDVFVDSLAASGDPEGTLKRRLRAGEMAGAVRAKTGSLRGVSALSGLVTTSHGEQVIFSVLMNRTTSTGAARKAQDAFCTVLRDYVSD